MALSNRGAQKRTLDIPGVDTREQRDLAALKLTGPAIRKASFRVREAGSVHGTHESHLVLLSHPSDPLCWEYEVDYPFREEGAPGDLVCEACSIEAARLRAVLA